MIKGIGKTQILVQGRTKVRKVRDFLKVDLGDEAVTISGLIQHELGRIPKVGEEVHIANCRLVIHDADPRVIKSVQIYKEEKHPSTHETIVEEHAAGQSGVTRSVNSASVRIRNPSFCAWSNFDPGSVPATTNDVFLLSLDETCPPRCSTRCFAWSRL